MVQGSEWLQRVYDRAKHHLLRQEVLHADEMTLQVLRKPGRAATTDSYTWLYRSGSQGSPDRTVRVSADAGGRASEGVPRGIQGISADERICGLSFGGDFEAVRLLGAFPSILRRGTQGGKEYAGNDVEGSARAHQPAVRDRTGTGAADAARASGGTGQAEPSAGTRVPQVDGRPRVGVLPKSLFGKAITYRLNQWEPLMRFFEDGRMS